MEMSLHLQGKDADHMEICDIFLKLKIGIKEILLKPQVGFNIIFENRVPAESANAIFVDFHSSNNGHCVVENTHIAIINRYYWPGMEEHICK